MLRSPTRSAFAVAIVLLGGCRQAPIEPAEPPLTASFVGEVLKPPGVETDPLAVGGISAVCYDASKRDWLALSDARVASRFFQLDVALDGAGLGVAVSKVVPLEGPDAKPFEENVLDPEGLVLSPWGTLLVSTEPDLRPEPVEQAKLLEFGQDGAFVRSFSVPGKFLVRGTPPDHGLRHNLAFEALSLSPDGALLFVGSEAPLFQDGPLPGVDAAAFSRIIVYSVEGRELSEAREYVYPLGPFAPDPDFVEQEVSGGLVELVALSDLRLLALERIFIQELAGEGRDRTRARIYEIDLSEASDVREIDSLESNLDWTPVRKELVIDLDDVIPSLSPDYPRLDNLEAMGLGPDLPGGGRALLLASDDNFQAQQRTQFLLLRLSGPGL